MCMPGTHRGQKRSPEVELELEMVVSCHWVLRMNLIPLEEQLVSLITYSPAASVNFFLLFLRELLRLELMKSCLCAGNIPTAFYSKYTDKLVTE